MRNNPWKYGYDARINGETVEEACAKFEEIEKGWDIYSVKTGWMDADYELYINEEDRLLYEEMEESNE